VLVAALVVSLTSAVSPGGAQPAPVAAPVGASGAPRDTGSGTARHTAGDTAQGAAQDTARVVAPCDGRLVTSIEFRTHGPYSAGVAGQWRPLARALTATHAVTRPGVLRSFLALHEGQPCTELRRAESERILRAQPFLAEVRVTTYDDGAGGIRAVVTTADDFSLQAGVTARGAAPHVIGGRLGDVNLAGQGISVVGTWANGLGLRDRYAGRITDYQFAGRPYELTVQGDRDVLGGYWSATLVHPFFTDLQRLGWIVDAGELRAYVPFPSTATGEPVTLDFSRHFLQVGGLARVRGGPGHLALFGLSVSEERDEPGTRPIFLSDSGGVRPDTNLALVARYAPLRAARLNAILGVRDVRFIRVSGFDALSGEQDITLGTEVGVVAGRSLGVLGSVTRDALLASGLYIGTGSQRYLLAASVRAEARRDFNTAVWDDILLGGRLAWYWRLADAHTFIASTEYSLGVDQRLPFVLTLSDVRGGVRGYHGSLAAGGERGVARFEERWRLGPVKSLAELGLATFTDVGRIWAQGVPFGVNSPTAVGVGLGVLVGVPVHSRHLWRVDFAVPVTHDPNARFEVRFSSTDAGAPFYLEPRDLARARAHTTPTAIFDYPPQ